MESRLDASRSPIKFAESCTGRLRHDAMGICQAKLPPFWVAARLEQLLGLLYEPIIRSVNSRCRISLWLDFIAGADKFFLRICTQIRMNYRGVHFPQISCRL